MESESLFNEMERYRRGAVIGFAGFFIGAILIVVLSLEYPPWGGLFGGLVCFVSLFFHIFEKRKLDALYKDKIVRNIILNECDFLTDVSFNPKSGISREESRALDFIYGSSYRSNDLIEAKHNGIQFRSADVTIYDISSDSDGNTHETIYFLGRWIVFDFNKNFHSEMRIVSKRFNSGRKSRRHEEYISMENENFNSSFLVVAQNRTDVFYVITPSLMDKIIRLQNEIGYPIALSFYNRKLHVAVYSGKDSMEPRLFRKTDIETEKEEILSELRIITKFVDMLYLEEGLFVE